MMKKKFLATTLMVATISGCSAGKVPQIKQHAAATFQQAGFEVIGYEGYEYGGFSTWGGRVWYTLRRVPDNGITYHAFISERDGEYHIYNLTAIDAIKPN